MLSDRIERRGRNRRIRELVQSMSDSREVLVAIAEILLDRTEDDAAVTRLLHYSALRNRELSEHFFWIYGLEKLELLAGHIRHGIEAGYLSRVNPVIAARAFLGMIVYHYLLEELFGVPRGRSLSTRELAEKLVGIFLEGISANHTVSKNGSLRKTVRDRSRAAVVMRI